MTNIESELKIQPGERILLMARKHWFVLLQNAIGVIVAGILPLLLLSIAVPVVGSLNGTAAMLFLFIGSLWLLIIWMTLATVWTSHYLDMWVVTERRVIYVEQVRFFVREIRTLSHAHMQDVEVRYGNFIETLLDFGTLRVQSAGAIQNDIVMRGMPHPHDVRNLMLNQAEAAGHHSNL